MIILQKVNRHIFFTFSSLCFIYPIEDALLRQGVFSVEICRNMEYYGSRFQCEEKEVKVKKVVVKEKCFVIMPISDPNGYQSGHFRYVYEDIFAPAIREAGFEPKRADDDESSSMIQINIVKDIIESPMAICDLSTRNPNVLFELGIRQAFDLPVVLVQEEDTPRIFDISTINTIDYRKNLIYREVLEDRENITKAIQATYNNTSGINSIIKLLDIEKKAEVGSNEMSADDEIKVLFATIYNRLNVIEKKIPSNEEAESEPESKRKLVHVFVQKNIGMIRFQ